MKIILKFVTRISAVFFVSALLERRLIHNQPCQIDSGFNVSTVGVSFVTITRILTKKLFSLKSVRPLMPHQNCSSYR